MMKRFLQFKKKLQDEKGFTLIELITVFMIMGIMSTILLFNFRTFNGKVQFENISQDIALRIVEAQKSAMTGKLNPNFVGRDVKPAYGVYFSSAPTAGTANKKFTYFTDIPGVGTGSGTSTGNKIYDPPTGIFVCNGASVSGNECLSVTTITTGEYVDNICYKTITGSKSCTGSYTSDLSVVFIRPFSDASLVLHQPSTAITTPIYLQAACVELASPIYTNSKRTILISNLGQIGSYNLPATSTTLACQS